MMIGTDSKSSNYRLDMLVHKVHVKWLDRSKLITNNYSWRKPKISHGID